MKQQHAIAMAHRQLPKVPIKMDAISPRPLLSPSSSGCYLQPPQSEFDFGNIFRREPSGAPKGKKYDNCHKFSSETNKAGASAYATAAVAAASGAAPASAKLQFSFTNSQNNWFLCERSSTWTQRLGNEHGRQILSWSGALSM